MTENKLVSIIIPCHNDGKYLPEAVASALAQTYAGIEILIVNVHSTDPQTLDVLRDMEKRGIRVLHTPEGKNGPSAARNVGIAAAAGDFILPLDADDRIEPTYVEKALLHMLQNPAVGICYCKARLFGLKRGPWRLPPYSWEEMLAGNVIFATAMFRKKDWETIGGYDETLRIGLEDYAFWLRVIALGREVFQIEEELFHYRIKSNSRTAHIARNDRLEQAIDGVFRSCESIFRQNAGLLFRMFHDLKRKNSEQTCLVSWKLCRHIFALEWWLRCIAKKILGRI